MTATPPLAAPRMSRRLVAVLAVACGLAVANNYYAQPLLDTIARQFGVSTGTAGLVVTLTQVGYAAGLVFLVPLGDLLERRRLVVTVLAGTALALGAAAAAPSIAVLTATATLFGCTSVVAQILVPFAATLAADEERGAVVGAVMSGLLLGVLLARTVAGLVAEAVGWRSVYLVAALLMVGLAVVLRRELPRHRVETRLSYGGVLASVLRLVRAEPVLRLRSAYGALGFAAFSVLWTSIAFLLARPPFHYGEAQIGLFGFAGAAGAAAASVAGRLSDRGWTRPATGVFLAALLASFGLLAAGSRALVPLVVGVVLLDLGVQGTHILNQSEIYRLAPDARSRVTTAYMTTYFIGGAAGSATSAYVFGRAGWAGVCWLGGAISAAGVGLWLAEAWHRRPRRRAPAVEFVEGQPRSAVADLPQPDLPSSAERRRPAPPPGADQARSAAATSPTQGGRSNPSWSVST